ncbi:nicotinamide N-methyltransferase-like [Bufo gargarizans]|uniref:nicotinamide N-methyltransferase-like n=1 Tax=Bufo gargarizans TaxID=30331 RepID=UPI001CF573C7|nr:nicotinamide N-methyltransferase-like [Bufo gargarizans]XP_044134394.1 nicotinamide N-methyltransferase-like [Bufo gargarizans]
METPFTSQQTYVDEFKSSDYFKTYYVAEGAIANEEWTDFALRTLHETFTKGGVKGDTIIDFGAGPAIYQLLSACEVFDKIITSDYLEQNRAELQKWLKKDPGAFDWTPIIKIVCELEGNRENYEKKAEKLRSKVKEVLKCDALKRNPFDPIVLQPADCLLTCLCLEAPCEDIKSYCNVLKNFKDLIKPGGHLVILSVLDATFYYVGDKYFSSMTTRKEELEQALKEAGYEIEKAVYTSRKDRSNMDVADYQGFYYIHARKPK